MVITLESFDVKSDIENKFGKVLIASKKDNGKLYKINIYKKRFVNE